MAKKKANQQSENNTVLPKNQHETPTDDAVSEKLHSLKSLNSMLLKETVERRQQVDFLSQVNKSLESELSRSVSDNASMQSDLSRLSERLLALEIEKGVASRVFSVKMAELEEVNRSVSVKMAETISSLESRLNQAVKEKSVLEGEIREEKFILSRVSEERDAIMAQMEDQIRIENGLRLKLAEAEKKEAVGLEELRKARDDYDCLVKEKTDLEEVNLSERVAMAEKIDGLERRLKEVLKEKSTLEGEIGEEKFILSRVSEERDAIRAQMEDRIRKENELRLKLAEVEKKEAVGLEELRKVRADYDGLVKEKASVERKMDSVYREKESIGRSLVESNGVVNDLRRDVNKITKEKMVIEDDRDLQVKKKNELQMSVDGLNELVNKLQQGKTELLEQISKLEKKSVMNTEKEAEMSTKIDVLVKEKQEIKAQILQVAQEKSLVTKDLEEALKKLSNQNHIIDELVEEKTKINDAKNEGATQIIKFKEELENLRKTVKNFEKSIDDQGNSIKRLESENGLYRARLDQATVERDGALVSLEGEKVKVKELTMNISMVEKKLEDTQKKLSKMQKETEQLAAEKKGLENTRAEIENKILVVKKSLAQQDDQEAEFGEEIKDIVTEIEAIKKCCKDKESVIEEMTKQLDMLKACVVRADKGKSFWTMVSSATAILAAVSFACVARGGN